MADATSGAAESGCVALQLLAPADTGESDKAQANGQRTEYDQFLNRGTATGTTILCTDIRNSIIASLQPKEAKAFVAFREKVNNAGLVAMQTLNSDSRAGIDDDVTLQRFARARQYNVDGAYAQCKEATVTHQTYSVVTIYDDIDVQEFDSARLLYPYWTGRVDKRGIPICIFDVAVLSADRLADFSNPPRDSTKARPSLIRGFACLDALTRFVLPMVNLARPISETKPPVSSLLYLVDITRLSYKQVWAMRKYVSETSNLLANNYPETVDQILVLGAPMWLAKMWSWCKSWIEPATAEKIVFLPAANTLTFLEEMIDIENIPKRYGGEFDGTFGMLPSLDGRIMSKLAWFEGVERKIPKGPLKWVVQANGKHVLVAVGTKNGSKRRERLASVTPPYA